MNLKTIVPLFILGTTSCRFQPPKKLLVADKVYVGLNNVEIYKRDKKNSPNDLPPPPVKENIANNAFIESNDGRIYFYRFAKRPPLCGYMQDGNAFELYKQDLDSLKPQDLMLVDSADIGNVIKLITAEKRPVFIIIGIRKDTSTNRTLALIVDTLYRNSVNNIWKARKTNTIENNLMAKL